MQITKGDNLKYKCYTEKGNDFNFNYVVLLKDDLMSSTRTHF